MDFVTNVFDACLNDIEATIHASAAEPGAKLFSRLQATREFLSPLVCLPLPSAEFRLLKCETSANESTNKN